MKRILMVSNYSKNDISSLNCAFGPFTLMKDVELLQPFRDDGKDYLESKWWLNFKNWLDIDVCFLHRPFGWYGQQIIKYAKLHGVPLWVHHDDDLLKIPSQNPCHGIVEEDAKNPSIELSYKEADVLTCQSTIMQKELKEKYGREDTVLLPITMDDRLLPFKKHFTVNNRISWRGSPSHVSDLLFYKEWLQDVFNIFSDHEFHFFGIDPRAIGFKVKKLVYHEELPMFEFYKKLSEINASIHLVLLEPTPFNHVKSHLAWLDAVLAGSVVLAPDFPEFQRPGVFHYLQPENLALQLQVMITSKKDLEAHHYLAWDFIHKNFLHSSWQKARENILREI